MTDISGLTASTTQYQVQGSHHRNGKDPLTVAAKALGMTTDDLKTQLKDGKSLDDVAKAKGVSHDDLVKALKDNMPSDMASKTDASQMIEKMVSRQGMPPGGGHGGPPPGPPPGGHRSHSSSSTGALSGTLTTDQQDLLDQLGSVLGTDTDTLVSALQSGTSLTDLLSSAGSAGKSLAASAKSGVLYDATL